MDSVGFKMKLHLSTDAEGQQDVKWTQRLPSKPHTEFNKPNLSVGHHISCASFYAFGCQMCAKCSELITA